MNAPNTTSNNENFQNLKKKILEKKTLPQIKIPASKESNNLKEMMSLLLFHFS